MCGICGILSFTDTKPLSAIEAMVQCLTHRGPDAQKSIILDRISLGHTRLSIIDTSARADQPFCDTTERYWIVFNGEIYNYRTIRKKLIDLGHQFKTSSDTEVIVNGYKQWGTDIVSYLRGMFAFAVWDTKTKELFLARDRIGEKPLVYAFYNNCFYFASEINALLACGIPKDIDEIGLLHYFGTMTAIPPPLTIYRHIKKFEQAHYALLEGQSLQKKKYWHPAYKPDYHVTTDEWIERLNHTMDEVTALTLTADVPVGLCLSGGVDSGALCAFAHEHNKDLYYFVLSSLSEKDPEVERAQRVAKQYGLSLTVFPFPLLDDYEPMKHMSDHYGEPFCLYPHIYGSYFNKQIRNHVKTVITGTGADEILYGYTMYNTLLKSTSYRLFNAVNNIIRSGPLFNYFSMVRSINSQNNLMLNNDIIKKHSSHELIQPYKHIFNEATFYSLLSSKSLFDLLYYHYHSTVYFPDIASMQFGLESRSPYLDHRFIELIAQIPINILLPDPGNPHTNKYLLKKALEPRLPPDVVYAKKMGFGYGINYYETMKTTWKPVIENTLFAPRYAIDQYINVNKITGLWNKFLNGDLHAGNSIFSLLQFLHWWDLRQQ
ncbi:MAG: asparagine synthase (glutamine-hydrolyzing) [Elusimicrobia bacterium]|nr:asparagine synthase (glutamine-hydrolyzing) [Elusimicrobiota bacterium]